MPTYRARSGPRLAPHLVGRGVRGDQTAACGQQHRQRQRGCSPAHVEGAPAESSTSRGPGSPNFLDRRVSQVGRARVQGHHRREGSPFARAARDAAAPCRRRHGAARARPTQAQARGAVEAAPAPARLAAGRDRDGCRHRAPRPGPAVAQRRGQRHQPGDPVRGLALRPVDLRLRGPAGSQPGRGRRRQRDWSARRRTPGAGQPGRPPRARAPGRPGRRGRQPLQPQRGRSRRRVPGDVPRHCRAHPGGEHDHPAARQAQLHREPAHRRAEVQGAALRQPAGGEVHQGRAAGAVPQPGLLRRGGRTGSPPRPTGSSASRPRISRPPRPPPWPGRSGRRAASTRTPSPTG